MMTRVHPTTMSDRLPGDPTPDEIRERCLEIQAGWSEDERLRRGRCKVCRGQPSEVGTAGPAIREFASGVVDGAYGIEALG